MTRCVVWETWNCSKAAWRVEEFLFLPASCQVWENRTCSFPPSLLQRNVYFVAVGRKKENTRFYLLLLWRCVRWHLFYEDYPGSSGAARNEGDLQFAVESCGCLCIPFPAERKLALAATKVNAKFKCIFFKKIISIAFYSQTLNDFLFLGEKSH